MKAQNIYDDPIFFSKYSDFPRAKEGEHGASEWPELLQMLPRDLSGKRILDLACGEGWFARWCVGRGARAVDACDLSVNMLNKAERRTATPRSAPDEPSALMAAAGRDDGFSSSDKAKINFTRVDLEHLELPVGTYDLVFCGLALHYVNNLANVMHQVHSSLAPGGMFVFSVEHPLLTAPTRPGFIRTPDEVDQWPVDNYFAEGAREVDWLVKGVRKQHHTMSSYFRMLRNAGFEVESLDEWGATEQSGRKHPDWVEGVCPRFLLVMSRRKIVKDRTWTGLRSILGFSSQ